MGRLQMIFAGAPIVLTIIAAIGTLWWTSHEAFQKANDLETRLTSLTETVASNRVQVIRLQDDINKEREWQLRTDALLWLKTYGTPFPTDQAVYPNVGGAN